MNARRFAKFTSTTLALLAAGTAQASAPRTASADDIDAAALARIEATYGAGSAVVAHIDLTEPFGTRRPWTLVVAKQPDAIGAGWEQGAVSVCFVKGTEPDCADTPFMPLFRKLGRDPSPNERPPYELLESRVVHIGLGTTLLALKACTAQGGNGNCGVVTLLFAYDAAHERFRVVFSNITGRNNNEATRFIESGPLQGAVVVATPTDDAPFAYWIEVHRPAANGTYRRVLHYRGRTGYGDGNPLSVIDSEMPALLGRLGLWKAGDALPMPPALPEGCTRLHLRKGVMWCGAQ